MRIVKINSDSIRIMRVYHEYLSQQSFEKIYGPANMVGVSGDNTFERSVAYHVLPFYHSSNFHIITSTFLAIRTMIQAVDFGFSVELKKDLITYFSYAGHETEPSFWRALFQIDLEEIKAAWSIIAAYIKEHKNFYSLFENFILMPALSKEEFSYPDQKIAVMTTAHNQSLVYVSAPSQSINISSQKKEATVSAIGFFKTNAIAKGSSYGNNLDVIPELN